MAEEYLKLYDNDSYLSVIVMHLTHTQFRDLAWKFGLAATHQRQVIYETVVASHGHYSPEQIYADVRRRVPSISLATVYKNVRLFVDHGLLREVTPHAPVLRVDGNLDPHHHLVCIRCKSVQDIEDDFVDFKRLSRQLPGGFDLTQPLVEVFGLCQRCSAKPQPTSAINPTAKTRKTEKKVKLKRRSHVRK